MADIERIKRIIAEREDELKSRFDIKKAVPREEAGIIKQKITKNAAVIITGIRRCGKSTLAFMLGKDEKFVYINFDDERLNIKSEELNDVLEAAYSLKEDVETIILDEIQNIPGWEKFAARLIGGKKIIITGSNAKLLSKELATHLTGRHLDFMLMPFSFGEFLAFNDFKPNIYLTKDIAKSKSYLTQYIEKGGLPLSYSLGKLFLVETYKDIIERDIIQRYNIKNIQSVKELSALLISNYAREITYNSLKNSLGLKSSHTVKKYAGYLEDSYLFFIIERFSFKLKEQMLAPKKVYCVDTGLIKAQAFENSLNRGRLIENLIATELIRRKHKTEEMTDIYYYKDHQQREVDFLVKKGSKITELIQAAYDLNDIKTLAREKDSLLRASDELKCKNLKIITWDTEKIERVKNKEIKYIPLWKWLLT